eukprot:snap_masked-scaffold_59-processed-gene-0.79-mRNA-1 protein AED:1.00 eAED:1.00 QI:0/0/0/0/1/1/2/0/59
MEKHGKARIMQNIYKNNSYSTLKELDNTNNLVEINIKTQNSALVIQDVSIPLVHHYSDH